jgi:hypothetical protein
MIKACDLFSAKNSEAFHRDIHCAWYYFILCQASVQNVPFLGCHRKSDDLYDDAINHPIHVLHLQLAECDLKTYLTYPSTVG